ncbi:hypothetical protein PIIN_06855 [Serendipita indica DSM 11827]|uniref:Uncharacterized protein n=1 Tax=Serendipita indica (strain DSM 11827) TaxID=1109443 RepID=G4TNM6_SERID|nr:hypothetical protein PIIN_06855 [Serendipita indica DSM 11827]
MKPVSLLFAFAMCAAPALALSHDIRGMVKAPTSVEINKRQCETTSCMGFGWKSGIHCGDGNFGCISGNAYQVGDKMDNVCDYGPRTSCRTCGKLDCSSS